MNYKMMKVFDWQNMPTPVAAAFEACAPNNETIIQWTIWRHDAYSAIPDWVSDNKKIVDDWLVENGAEPVKYGCASGERVLIMNWR